MELEKAVYIIPKGFKQQLDNFIEFAVSTIDTSCFKDWSKEEQIIFNWLEESKHLTSQQSVEADVLPQCKKCGSSFLWFNNDILKCGNPSCHNSTA